MERLTVVEAKGGNSKLGYRQLDNANGVAIAQQGTSQYLTATISKMKASSDRATRQIAVQLELALMQGKVDYYLARTAIGKDANGLSTVKPTTLQKFELTSR